LKVVYNSLFHPHLIYSILNWGRGSNGTVQLFTHYYDNKLLPHHFGD